MASHIISKNNQILSTMTNKMILQLKMNAVFGIKDKLSARVSCSTCLTSFEGVEIIEKYLWSKTE
jgi:hypothetical protein